MCGSQNVSEPKIVGLSVGVAHAEAAEAAAAPAVSQGTGGHYSGTREETLAFEHGLRRMGINRSEVRTVISPPFFLELNKHLFCVFDACRLFLSRLLAIGIFVALQPGTSSGAVE